VKKSVKISLVVAATMEIVKTEWCKQIVMVVGIYFHVTPEQTERYSLVNQDGVRVVMVVLFSNRHQTTCLFGVEKMFSNQTALIHISLPSMTIK
jgi:hypothetical protein